MYRQLGPRDTAAVTRHYLALCVHDRNLRFGSAKSDEAVARYCLAIDWRHARLFGCFVRHQLRGLIELSAPLAGPSRSREAAIAVGPAWRRRGIGRQLVQFAAAAQSDSCDRFLFFWQRGNDAFPPFLAACGGVADRQRGLGWIELSTLRQVKPYAGPMSAGSSLLGAIGAL